MKVYGNALSYRMVTEYWGIFTEKNKCTVDVPNSAIWNIWFKPWKAVPTAWPDHVEMKGYARYVEDTQLNQKKKGRWGAIIWKWLQNSTLLRRLQNCPGS